MDGRALWQIAWMEYIVGSLVIRESQRAAESVNGMAVKERYDDHSDLEGMHGVGY